MNVAPTNLRDLRSRAPSESSLSSEALTRASGIPLIEGNRVVLLKDAAENYPRWIGAIETAKQWIHFETYIFHEDSVGRQFAELLSTKAREGVKVRLIYDWIGSLGYTSRRLRRGMQQAGIEIRRFNRPSLDNPLGWINRDHRKVIVVDGQVGFVGGLCVGQQWIGVPEKNIGPWRDTAVEVEGPAVADIELAFADSWATAGAALPVAEQAMGRLGSPAGDIALRIVPGVPNGGSLYRFDQLIAAFARKSFWLADAYFVGTSSYVQLLCTAARAGIDVRLLLPGVNDMPVMRAVARAGLRPLLEAGVRVFEWNGSMMHAKTAVCDGHWSRVGSTNLNVISWMSNRELDVVIENEQFARQMEEAYLKDLANSTEIVLRTAKPRALTKTDGSAIAREGRAGGARRTAAGMMRLGNTVGAAIANRRELGPAEAVIVFWGAIVLLLLGLASAYWPRAIAIPIAVFCLWMALSLLGRAYKLRSKSRK